MQMLNQTTSILSSFVTIVIISLSFFIVSLISLIFLFGGSLKIDLKKKSIILLLLFSFLAPFFSIRLYKDIFLARQTPLSVPIQELQILRIGQNSVQVSFDTTDSIIVYLEYTDKAHNEIVPVLPSNGLQKQTHHTFTVKDMGSAGGTALLVVSGTKYLVDGKPIVLSGR